MERRWLHATNLVALGVVLAWAASAFAQPPDDRKPADPPARQQPAQSDPPAKTDQTPQTESAAAPDARALLPPGTRIPVQPPRDRVSELIKTLDPATLNRLIGADVKVEFVGGQIILKGPEEAVKTLELLIRALDQEIPQKELRVVTVQERDAKEVARTMQDALREAKQTPNQRDEDQITLTSLTANILLVSALPEDIDWVVSLIEDVDSVPDPLGKIELMTFDVQFRKASDVGKELERVLQQLQSSAGIAKDKSKLQIIPNNANNTITITARETERQKIQDLINNIDVEPKKGWGEVKLTVYPLLHSKAADLAKVIQDLLAQQSSGARGGGGGGAAGGGGSSSAGGALEEVIYRLVISKASPTGEISELPPIDLQKANRIIADDGTNSLIVATVEENVEPMGELIRLLDGVPLGVAMNVRLFPLRFADAETVAETLNNMFESGKELPQDPDGSGKEAVPDGAEGKALVYNISVSTDIRTNTLIVAGRAEQMELVDKVVSQLDQPATSLKFPLRLVALTYADATRIAQLLKDLFDKRIESAEAVQAGTNAVERDRVFITVDIPSNSLIVAASEDNVKEIRAMAKQLDARPAKPFEQIRTISLSRLSAQDMKEKIDELWQRKTELLSALEAPADTPILVADERSNVLVVASSLDDYEEIKRLVAALESQPLVDDMRLFKLEFADANVLSDMLDKLFEGMAGNSETFKAPTLLPDTRSNAIVAAGARDSLERVTALLTRLDIPGGPQSATIKVYPLTNASAAKLATRMQELFDSRAEGDEGTRTPVVLHPDEASNSLVVSASRDDHTVVKDLLSMLDKPSNISRQFEIFPMKYAKAATVAEKLEALFASQAEGGGGGRADAIAAEADERTNSIIVWASPTEMLNIGDVIARLDTSTPVVEMMVKVIQLKQALAEDFATLLDETIVGENAGTDEERAVIMSFKEKDATGREVTRRLLRQDITVKPDPRTNSLLVTAPVDSMAMLESMIKDFDRIRPVRSELRLFPLINSDAESMVEKLKAIFSQEGEGGGAAGETRRQFVFGSGVEGELASVGQELRFEADRRTNTIIAAGAEVDLRMVEELVQYLDAQEANERVTGVYKAKYLQGSEIATAIQGFVEQEQQVLGEGDDEESRIRKQERQVSVESVGTEENGSSSVLYGTSSKNFQRTMEMIEQIDSPEPQVMINVLIAEVTLSDNLELGVEIAGQELSFSRNAVVGPNGVIDGSDFDFISGTDLGAAGLGLGGFNFTVTGEDFSFLLHALQTDSRLEILSRPILLVRNGEEGKITIADEVPIVESSQQSDTGSVRSTITRQDVGIVLTATPHISPDGYVTIDVTQEISNISGENIQLSEGVSSPVFAKREVDTNVTVRDGETVVIGGLIQQRDSEGENKVPLLGDLPLIGALFRTTNVSHSKTELIVVMTVDVLRSDEDVHRMSVQQRDRYSLPDSIRQSPFMEGLRILPREAALGAPRPLGPVTPGGVPSVMPAQTPAIIPPRGGDHPVPAPRTYGPVISKPAPASAAAPPPDSSKSSTFGPMIVQLQDRDVAPVSNR